MRAGARPLVLAAVKTDMDRSPALKNVSAGAMVLLLLVGAILFGWTAISVIQKKEYKHSGYSACGRKAVAFGVALLFFAFCILVVCGAIVWIVWG